MSAAPEIVIRADQPYVAIRGQVTMDGLGAFAARTPEVFALLGSPSWRSGWPTRTDLF